MIEIGDYVKTKLGSRGVVLAVTDEWVVVKKCDEDCEEAWIKELVIPVMKENEIEAK